MNLYDPLSQTVLRRLTRDRETILNYSVLVSMSAKKYNKNKIKLGGKNTMKKESWM